MSLFNAYVESQKINFHKLKLFDITREVRNKTKQNCMQEFYKYVEIELKLSGL